MTTTERPEVVALAEALFEGCSDQGIVRIWADGPKELFDIANSQAIALAAKGFVVVRADRIERLEAALRAEHGENYVFVARGEYHARGSGCVACDLLHTAPAQPARRGGAEP